MKSFIVMKYFYKIFVKTISGSKTVVAVAGIASLFFFVFHTVQAVYIPFLRPTPKVEKVLAKASKDISLNSSMAILPVAAVNSDPNPEKSFDVVPVYSGETLVSDLANTDVLYGDISNKISIYVVREGDTISSIAKMFDVSKNTILWANDISSRTILKVGQILTILPVTGIKHVVQKNETMSSIANKYRADLTEIYNYNDLDSRSKLVVGQIIIIPNAEMSSARTTVVRALNGMVIPDDPLTVNVNKLPFYPGYYSCPVTNAVVTQGLHGRNSVDLAAPVGTPLRASASGTITISRSNGTWNGGYGNFVVISHDNQTQTLYAHMSRSIVKPGDRVSQGQTIGYIGISGMTTGPHVHFEIRGARNPFDSVNCD